MPSIVKHGRPFLGPAKVRTKDRNHGAKGHAPCENCGMFRRVQVNGAIHRHSMMPKQHIPCPSTSVKFESAIKALNESGIGQQRIANTFGVTRHRVRKILGS